MAALHSGPLPSDSALLQVRSSQEPAGQHSEKCPSGPGDNGRVQVACPQLGCTLQEARSPSPWGHPSPKQDSHSTLQEQGCNAGAASCLQTMPAPLPAPHRRKPYLPHSIFHLHHQLLHSMPAMGMSACHVPVAGHLVARDAAVSGEQGRAACKLPAERRRRQGGWQPPSKSGCSSSPCALLKAAAQRRALSLPESRFSCSLGALRSPVPAASWVMPWAGWEG